MKYQIRLFNRALFIALALLWTVPVQAQPVAGDGLVTAWDTHRDAANIISNVSVVSALALDTWASWKAEDRKRAFANQAMRDALIFAVSEAVKRVVHRERPDHADHLSFWSEHTAFAASAIGGPRFVVVFPLTLATGYLRIAADRHFLTDTLAGAAVGATIGELTHRR